jgi:hypothetical protein
MKFWFYKWVYILATGRLETWAWERLASESLKRWRENEDRPL